MCGPIALARGLLALRQDEGQHIESHIDEAAAYFAPGGMSKDSYTRFYASPSRLLEDCSPNDAAKKIHDLSRNNASCIRVYLKCIGYGDKIRNKSPAQKKGEEVCFGPGKFCIEELWITTGELQNTEKAVSYFTVPREIVCIDSKGGRETPPGR